MFQKIQCLKIESSKKDEVIDHWTDERKTQLEIYEKSIKRLDEKVKRDEIRRKEQMLNEKIREENTIREWRKKEAEHKNRVRDEQLLNSAWKRKELKQNYQI